MCGILSVVSEHPMGRQDLADVLNSLSRIKHRGPDGEGVMLIDRRTGLTKTLKTADTPNGVDYDYQSIEDVAENSFDVVFCHRRLSIIDLSVSGHQPMNIHDVVLNYNGEIYNYIELRKELKDLGYSFVSDSDTEVIIQAYREWGTGCLNRFNGMWSFTLYDKKTGNIFISNDRFGVKPLYYSTVGSKTIIASEVKQFIEFSEFDKALNETYINNYIELGTSVVNTDTLFKAVNRFPNGNYTIISKSKKLKKQYFEQFHSIYGIQKRKWKKEDAIETFRNIFFDAVKIRTRADVPYGVGLSGGVDSSAVLVGVNRMLKEKGESKKPFTFSAIFPSNTEDESIHINKMLDSISCSSHFINPLKEFDKQDFRRHIYHQEFLPGTTSFYAQWKVAQLARKADVPVMLVGQGADEVFAGYHAHFYRLGRQLILEGKILTYLKLINQYSEIKGIPKNHLHNRCIGEFKLAIKLKIGLKKYDHHLTKYWDSINSLSSFLKAEFDCFQLPYYLISDDRTAMASSIETRHPFLDYRLVEFGYSLPNNLLIKEGWQKWLVRESIEELPKDIRWRRDKKGFTIPQRKFENLIVDQEHNGSSDRSFRLQMVKILKEEFLK